VEGDEFVSEDKTAPTAIWRTAKPSEQARAPEWMSFHVFKDAQRCPLSVTLQRSSYKELWDGFGYPTRPNAMAVTGIVVHEAAETIMRRLAQAGVASLMQPEAMGLLKDLGGFTKVLERAIDELFANHSNNPRFVQVRDDLLRTLRTKLPQMRATLQSLIVGHVWTSAPSVNPSLLTNARPSIDKYHSKREPLELGTFVEVDLQDCQAKWRGRIDVLEVDDTGCAITDLKSGAVAQEHKDQLLVYAMLWSEDTDRNPTHLPVRYLRIVYVTGTVEVNIPSTGEMQDFRKSILESSEQVRSLLDADNVPANPSRENCRYCPVKLLCGAYWGSSPIPSADERISNNEVTLLEPRGERAWLATVEASTALSTDQQVIVRNYEGGKAFWREFHTGLVVRLTEGVLPSCDEGETPIINLTMMSEALFLE
jgi:CRISPR/Cas system-associated exonuclease Cas4 (RecB family)